MRRSLPAGAKRSATARFLSARPPVNLRSEYASSCKTCKAECCPSRQPSGFVGVVPADSIGRSSTWPTFRRRIARRPRSSAASTNRPQQADSARSSQVSLGCNHASLLAAWHRRYELVAMRLSRNALQVRRRNSICMDRALLASALCTRTEDRLLNVDMLGTRLPAEVRRDSISAPQPPPDMSFPKQ